MSHEELVEEFTRENRYRVVLVVAVIVGILASAVVGIAFSLGRITMPHDLGSTGSRGGGLGFFAIPFAVSILIGGGIYHSLCFYGKRRAHRTR